MAKVVTTDGTRGSISNLMRNIADLLAACGGSAPRLADLERALRDSADGISDSISMGTPMKAVDARYPGQAGWSASTLLEAAREPEVDVVANADGTPSAVDPVFNPSPASPPWDETKEAAEFKAMTQAQADATKKR